MARHIVHCRVCKGEIETNSETNWIMPSRNFYYHRDCYESWQTKKNDVNANVENDELWKDATYQYLLRDLYIAVDYNKFASQWKNFLKKGRTAKGIYFTVRYFYEIEKGDRDKAQGGIGIVDYVYNDACAYWVDRERKGEQIVSQIEAQVKQEKNRKEIAVVKRDKKKKKKAIDLSEI